MSSQTAATPELRKPAAYSFDLDLSSADARTGAVRGLIPRTDHEAALARIRDEARSTGLAEGAAKAEARAAERLADAAGKIVGALDHLVATADRECEIMRRDASILALAAARNLAGHLIAREPLGEVEALIESCLGPLRNAPHLVIRLRAEDAAALREHLGPIVDRSGFTGRLVILGEDDMAAGDCRVEWADGGMVRDIGKALAAMEDALARRFAALGPLPDRAVPSAGPNPSEGAP